jgi:TolA-binding protein
MRRFECSSDLVARSRRRALTDDERIRLEAHLEGCTECQLELELGADFDAMAGVRPGDDVLDARLAEDVLRRLSGRRRPTRSVVLPMMAAAAACTLIAAAALAGVGEGWVRRTLAPPAAHVESAAIRAAAVAARVGVAAIARPGEPADPATAREASPPAAPLESTPAATPAATVVATSAARAPRAASSGSHGEGETAASLFQSANAERRRGHLTTAISLYDELERRFPRSEEARTSHVSLGRLLLERGLWADALPQLDEYLTASPAGTLAPEALFGEARALEALGRRDEARRAWSHLLGSYPDSVYATQARQRLQSPP